MCSDFRYLGSAYVVYAIDMAGAACILHIIYEELHGRCDTGDRKHYSAAVQHYLFVDMTS